MLKRVGCLVAVFACVASSVRAISTFCFDGLEVIAETTPGESIVINGTTCGKLNNFKAHCSYGFGEDDGYVYIVPRVGPYSVTVSSPTGRVVAVDVRQLDGRACKDAASLICVLTRGTAPRTGTYYSGSEPGTALLIALDNPYGGCSTYTLTVTPPPLD